MTIRNSKFKIQNSKFLISRRQFVRDGIGAAAMFALPIPFSACAEQDPEVADSAGDTVASPVPQSADEARFHEWVDIIVAAGYAQPDVSVGRTATEFGELAADARTPYKAYTLEEYLKAGGDPSRAEPLTLSLQYFDCVTLVESCLALARVARTDEPPTWEAFAREMERMRYRDGVREGYTSRLHYFSEWLDDNARRGLVRQLGEELGGMQDTRPLRFMSTHADAYPALAHPEILQAIIEMEKSLDDEVRWVVPTERIAEVSDSIQTGDILAFATSIEGLDVTHAAYAYRDDAGVLRVLHAPLSGGVVEITDSTLPEYVAAINGSTGILVARPLQG
ncbi:MAG TPA: N-acetylmuramoyl-L-alanine amidase-like domain-containing protein [Longimicrobiaceae bacterium]|nr:N-acetylmuramoyl-L-alanine amidase-like domain-containing protein [Longimicrobiaceae bacterium]